MFWVNGYDIFNRNQQPTVLETFKSEYNEAMYQQIFNYAKKLLVYPATCS